MRVSPKDLKRVMGMTCSQRSLNTYSLSFSSDVGARSTERGGNARCRSVCVVDGARR